MRASRSPNVSVGLASISRGRIRAKLASERSFSSSYHAIHHVLTNPAYAGAYVYGKTRTEVMLRTQEAHAASAARAVASSHPRAS
jgi:hypothetical protein